LKPKIEVSGNTLIVDLNGEYRSIASTMHKGGISRITHILVEHVEKCTEECTTPEYAVNLIRNRGLDPETTALFLTGANLPEQSTVKTQGEVFTLVTAGFTPMYCSAGPEEPGVGPGTINTIVVVDECLRDQAAVELVALASSAKTAALADAALGCGPGKGRAVATGTDAILVAFKECQTGVSFAGPLTRLGRLVSSMIYDSIAELASKISLEERFRHITGITLGELEEVALEYYGKAPVPGLSRDEVARIFRRLTRRVLGDPNTWLLLIAARSLDDSGLSGTVPLLNRDEYLDDTKGVVADELLGIALSMYINGWKGLFSYYWIDRTKDKDSLPGSLPMFTDDIIGALVGGVLSRLYDETLPK
jgi:alpha-ribazole phosphatase CobZ